MTDLQRYETMFDYLREVPAPEESAGLLVFGRKDPLVAHAAGDLIIAGMAEFGVITGGLGKDSGDLKEPEAEYLAGKLCSYLSRKSEETGVLPPPTLIFTETAAANGAQNVNFSLELMDKTDLTYRPSLTTVAHAVSARRLHELTIHEAAQRSTPIEDLRGVATDITFESHRDDPKFRKEIIAEYLRFADWPGKGWLRKDANEGLDNDLIDFARDTAAANK